MLRVVTFKIEEELLERIDKIANKLGVSRSVVIRWAIQRWVANFKENEEKNKTETEKVLGKVEVVKIDI